VGSSVGDLGRIGPSCGEKYTVYKICKGSSGVMCGGYGVYENGTYMYNGVPRIYMLLQSRVLVWCVSCVR